MPSSCAVGECWRSGSECSGSEQTVAVMAAHPFITLLRNPSVTVERIDAFVKGDSEAAHAGDPHTQRTALHVICANVCLADEDSLERSSVLLLARRVPEALSARDLHGATPLELLVDHGGLTTPLLMQLVKLRPEITRQPLRIGSWWEQRRDSTILQWLCSQHDVTSAAIEDLLSMDRGSLIDVEDTADNVAAAVDSWTGRSALHALCDNEQFVAHKWADFLKAARTLAAAAPQMVVRADRQGLKPCDLLERQHLLRGEALAILVNANPSAAASRLALPPWEQSEWATRKPVATEAAEQEVILGKEKAEENKRRAADALVVFDELECGLSNSRESECTAAAIRVRRVYEHGDAIVRQAAVDNDRLCAGLVKLLHRPRCSAPRSAAQRTLACLSAGDTRLAEKIKKLKAQEMQEAKELQRQIREQGRTACSGFHPPAESESEPEPEPAPNQAANLGRWRYAMVDGEWEYVASGQDGAMDTAKPDHLQLGKLLEQSDLAQSRKEGLQKLDTLTQAYNSALVKLIMDDEQSKMDNQMYLEMKQGELQAMDTSQLRGEAVDRGLDTDRFTWLRGKIGEVVPNLIELLRGLDDDAERLTALQTVKEIVRDLARDRSFLHALPQLTAEIFFLKCGQDGVVFAAANECLDEIIACSTHGRLVSIAEEAVGTRNEDRVRHRAMNCLLQILLQWPNMKLDRQEPQFKRILLTVMNPRASTTRYMRKIARRAAMVLLRRLPQKEAEFRADLGPSLAAQVETEDMWTLAQLRKCTFSIANVTDTAVVVEPTSVEVHKDGVKARQNVHDPNRVASLSGGGRGQGGTTKPEEQLRPRELWKKAKVAALITAAGYTAAVRDAQRTTPLHWLCASETVSLGELKSLLAVLTLDSRLAEDSYRRTPLHVLCANRLVTGAMLQAMLYGLSQSAVSTQMPSKEMLTSHLDETKRNPLHHLCSNWHVWRPEKIDVIATVLGQWTGWDKQDCEGRTPLDLLALNRWLNAATLEALINSAGDSIAKLKIFTRPDDAHAPVTMDEDNICTVLPLHWLCMQHLASLSSQAAISASTLQKVVTAFPDACAIPGPDGNTPLHLLCKGQYTTTAHFLAVSAALSSCWEVQNDNGDRPLDLLATAERRLTPATLFELIKHTPRVAEVPMKDVRNPWSKEPMTVLHWICHTLSQEPDPGVRSSLLGHLPASADYRELLMDLIFKYGQVDHKETWRSDLAHLKTTTLRKRAMSEGVPSFEVQEAEDSYDPKAALIDLIVTRLQTKDDAGAALRAELQSLYNKEIDADQEACQEDTGDKKDRERSREFSGSTPVGTYTLHNWAVKVVLQGVIAAFPDAVVRQDEEGRTPLHIYCAHRAAFTDAITVLGNQMTDLVPESIHFRDAYSNSALDLLLAHGALSVDLLEYIVGACSNFATVDVKDTLQFGLGHAMKVKEDCYITPLHWLCAQQNLTHGCLRVVMVAAGSAAARIDGRGQTPLHYLCKNKGAASPEMLALFQTLNEDAVAAIDSKQVLLSHASAEDMVCKSQQPQRNAGDAARDLLGSTLAEQTNRVRSMKKRQAHREKQRRRAAEVASASPHAVRQAQALVDRRAKVAVKAMKAQAVRKSRSNRQWPGRQCEVCNGFGESDNRQGHSTAVRGAHFLSAPQRPLLPNDRTEHPHHPMAEIIASILDRGAIKASAGRFQLQQSWQQLPNAKRKDGPPQTCSDTRGTRGLVDWAAKDHSGATALHLLCTNPTKSTPHLLRWAAECPATTDAWSKPNSDGRTPLDVLQFTCQDVNQGLTARLLKELVVKSDGRLAAVPLREISDAPAAPLVEPTPGDLTFLAYACGDYRVTEQDLAEIIYARPQALVHASGKLRRNPLHVLCANPYARPAHLRCIVHSPCGREAVAAQDARGNTGLHLLCQNPRAVCEDACAILVAEYTPVISVQNCVGRLPIHYAAALGTKSSVDTVELERLLKLLSVAPSIPGRKRPKRVGKRRGLAPTRDVFGQTPLEILARNGNAGAGLVKSVAGAAGKLGVSLGRSDVLIGEAPIGAVDHHAMTLVSSSQFGSKVDIGDSASVTTGNYEF